MHLPVRLDGDSVAERTFQGILLLGYEDKVVYTEMTNNKPLGLIF